MPDPKYVRSHLLHTHPFLALSVIVDVVLGHHDLLTAAKSDAHSSVPESNSKDYPGMLLICCYLLANQNRKAPNASLVQCAIHVEPRRYGVAGSGHTAVIVYASVTNARGLVTERSRAKRRPCKSTKSPERRRLADQHGIGDRNHAIRGLEERLDRIENGVDAIRQAVAKLDLLGPRDTTRNVPPSSSNPEPTSISLTTTACSYTLPDLSQRAPQWPAGHPGFRHRVREGDNGNRSQHTGPTTLGSMILGVKEFVLEPVYDKRARGSQLHQVATHASQSLDLLLDAGNKHNEPMIDDGMEPELPPVAILEAMTEPYFDFINPHMPIWTRQAFGRLIETCQVSSSGDTNEIRDRAGIVCANNMVLLTLTAKLLKNKAKRRVSRGHVSCRSVPDRQRVSTMELDLLKTFLANARRALNKIEQLLSPSISNIQAFLSLVRPQLETEIIFADLGFWLTCYLP